jgi:hypothetical protein
MGDEMEMRVREPTAKRYIADRFDGKDPFKLDSKALGKCEEGACLAGMQVIDFDHMALRDYHAMPKSQRLAVEHDEEGGVFVHAMRGQSCLGDLAKRTCCHGDLASLRASSQTVLHVLCVSHQFHA